MLFQFYEYNALTNPILKIPKKDYEKNITKNHLVVNPIAPNHWYKLGIEDPAIRPTINATENYHIRDLTFKGMKIINYKGSFIQRPQTDVLPNLF